MDVSKHCLSLICFLCNLESRLPKLPDTVFDANEWKTLEGCTKLLKPAEILAAETYCTMSMILPLIGGMQIKI